MSMVGLRALSTTARPTTVVSYVHKDVRRFIACRALQSEEDAPDTQPSTSSSFTSEEIPAVRVADERDNMPYEILASISAMGALGTVSGSCSTILDSSYAQVFGVPLSLLGMLTYSSVAFLAAYGIVTKSQEPISLRADTLKRTRFLIMLGTSVLAGTSLTLLATLFMKFPGTTCAYCIASATFSATLFALAFSGLPSQQRRATGQFSVGCLLSTAVIMAALYTTYPEPTNAGVSLAYQNPVVTEASMPGARDLAIRLREQGAKMYGAFWCSHCYTQKQIFGVDAAADLPYVECYPNGAGGGQPLEKVCQDADIQGFPTWIINGQKVEGDWPLSYLSAVLDGADPKAEAAKY